MDRGRDEAHVGTGIRQHERKGEERRGEERRIVELEQGESVDPDRIKEKEKNKRERKKEREGKKSGWTSH